MNVSLESKFHFQPIKGLLLWGLFLLFPMGVLWAHSETQAGVARVSNLEGQVQILASGDKPGDPMELTANAPVFETEVLVTGRRSAAQVALEDGTLLFLGERARLSPGLLPAPGQSRSPVQLRLWQGALLIEREEMDNPWGRILVDTPSGQVIIQGTGLIYLEVDSQETLLGVIKGYAELVGSKGAIRLGPGRSALLEFGYKPMTLGDFRSRKVEDLIWSMREAYWGESGRKSDREDPRISKKWDSRFTSTWAFGSGWRDLRRHGRFRWSIRFGWVWAPYHRSGWSPYTQGYWSWNSGGWYWVGSEPWGWVPYRYGSWAWDANWGWIWCPGYRYAPSWVIWSYGTNGWGWCPRNPYGKKASTPVGYIKPPVDQDPPVTPVVSEGPPRLPGPPPGRIIKPIKIVGPPPVPIKVEPPVGGHPILTPAPTPGIRPFHPGEGSQPKTPPGIQPVKPNKPFRPGKEGGGQVAPPSTPTPGLTPVRPPVEPTPGVKPRPRPAPKPVIEDPVPAPPTRPRPRPPAEPKPISPKPKPAPKVAPKPSTPPPKPAPEVKPPPAKKEPVKAEAPVKKKRSKPKQEEPKEDGR